jgi:hypothetical protein
MGLVLLVLGVAFLVVGTSLFLRAKRMAFARFRATGDRVTDPGVAKAHRKALFALVSGAFLTAGSIPAFLLGWPLGGTAVDAPPIPSAPPSSPASVPSATVPPPPPPPPPATASLLPPAPIPPPPSPRAPSTRKEPAPTKAGTGKKK